MSFASTAPFLAYKMADLVIVASDRHASSFEHHALEVSVGARLDDDRRLAFPCLKWIIAGEDVPYLCNIIPGICYEFVRDWDTKDWSHVKVGVVINVRNIALSQNDKADIGNDPPSVRRLLEPFRRLYGFRVLLRGHVTTPYKKSIEASAAQQPPTATELVPMVSNGRDEGNEAIQSGKPHTALTRYQSALDLMDSARIRFATIAETGQMGELLPDEDTTIAMNILYISLKSLLADTYLKVGAYAKSYGCAQNQILSSPYADTDADAPISVWPDLGHIMFCKALAGKALGQPVQALQDIDSGRMFCPGDEAMKEERKVLCALVRKKIDNDVRMSWADGLNTRTAKSKKSRKHQRSAETYDMARRRNLERLIQDE